MTKNAKSSNKKLSYSEEPERMVLKNFCCIARCDFICLIFTRENKVIKFTLKVKELAIVVILIPNTEKILETTVHGKVTHINRYFNYI